MKELSIEEKARRYDEAIKKLRSLHDDYDTVSTLIDIKKELEEILPELKEEPEDERIRKELLEHCKNQAKPYIQTGNKCPQIQSWIAWLEKQGEQKPTEWHREDEQNLNVCLGYIPDEFLRKWLMDVIHVKYDKPIDKVEPKFKVGDWVVSPNGVYWHIDKISNNRHEITSNTGESSDWPLDTNIYHRFYIQDAKDGDVLIDKSGNRECPFIFKETKQSDIKTDMLNPLTVLGYCGIGGAGFTKGSGWGDTANCIYYPATKEQRDTLMKAMTDAGYTFDFDKRELKKIERKPTEWIQELESKLSNATPEQLAEWKEKYFKVEPAWSEEDEKMINKLIDFMLSGIDISKAPYGCVAWLKSLKDRVQLQPKQEWSEEGEVKDDWEYIQDFIKKLGHFPNDSDELNVLTNYVLNKKQRSLKDKVQPQKEWNKGDNSHIQSILVRLEGMCEKGNIFTATRYALSEDISWLKSFKDRVQPQPKQEWSEEDEDMLYKAIAVINRLCAEGKEYVWSIKTLKKLFYWLKSLKPHSQESIEDKVNNFFDTLGDCGYEHASILRLKSIWKQAELPCPQNRWKPSDEQMWALSTIIANIPESASNACKKTAEGLLEQLKKLREE